MTLHSILVVTLTIAVSGIFFDVTSSLERLNKIVGGKKAIIEDVPYQVAYLTSEGDSPVCGGSILSETLVVTAAHCVRAYEVYVRVGTDKRKTNEGQTVRVKKIVVHENYDDDNNDNDIALLFLDTPLRFGNKVRPIKLPRQDQRTAAGTRVLASGWGSTNFFGIKFSDVLQKVTIPIVDQKRCENIYRDKITDRMICAGVVWRGGKDSCQGDSGGPLVGDSVLLGITSWGFGCGFPIYPGVYTRVAKYVNWIYDKNELYGSTQIL